MNSDPNYAQAQHYPKAPAITPPASEGSGNLRGAPPCFCDACRNDGRRIWLKDDADGEYKPIEHTDPVKRSLPAPGSLTVKIDEGQLAAFIRRILAEG